MGVVFDELKQLQPQSSPNRQLRPGQHFRVFFEDGRGDVETPRLCDRQEECSALKTVGFGRRRDNDICIDNEAQRKHQRFFFSSLTALMT